MSGSLTAGGEVAQVCNDSPIPGGAGGPTEPTPPYPSALYPSPIVVSGMIGFVTDVGVTLHNLTTSPDQNGDHFPEDIDVLLVAPTGENVILMSDAGGENLGSHPLNTVDLTFDDEAATALPVDTQITFGTYRPVVDADDPMEAVPTDTWPGAPAPSGSTSLSSFDGVHPSGTWQLYVVDDDTLPTTDVLGGWCLSLTTDPTPPPSTSTPPSTTSTTAAPTTSPRPYRPRRRPRRWRRHRPRRGRQRVTAKAWRRPSSGPTGPTSSPARPGPCHRRRWRQRQHPWPRRRRRHLRPGRPRLHRGRAWQRHPPRRPGHRQPLRQRGRGQPVWRQR